MKKVAFLMLTLTLAGSISAFACGMKDHSENGGGEAQQTQSENSENKA
jgi:hypothetical protein